MGKLEQLNLGIVGACRRGKSFRAACTALEMVNIHAVCDINEDDLEASRELLGADYAFTDYETMLAEAELDGVILGTPMQFHAPMTVAALEQDISVLCEVTAAVSVEECRQIVAAEKASRATYMMAENYTYMKPNVMVRELVRRGLFGTPYYAEGEYLHELKGLNETTVWRRRWQNGIDGITYGTHSLGPILQWMPGERVERVCCAGSGHHYQDPRGDDYAQDTSVMLCQTSSGGLIKIRVDMISDRPHAMTNYQLQGTDGCYESSRAAGEHNRIWLRELDPDNGTWTNLEELEETYLPEMWRQASDDAKAAGHGGGDYFEVLDFVDAMLGKRPAEIGVHEAMDMTLPGLVSQESIQQEGAWLPVPDSRAW